MADLHAIDTTMQAIRHLLDASYRPDLLENRLDLMFQVYATEDFRNPMSAGVSLFLYRVYVNATQRRPLARRPDGSTGPAQLPLDLQFLLTAWGRNASLQHVILGWAMRTLDCHAVLPVALLEAVRPSGSAFEPSSVEVVPGEMTNEDMFRLWEGFGTQYRLSVPYIARIVRIDPLVDTAEGGPVVERRFHYSDEVA
jgi:Pvc16 N-terminal domain